MDVKAALTMLAKAFDTPPQWQPIETAPYDGTSVLVWWVGRGGEGSCQVLGQIGGEWLRAFPGPTHWMPLPPPPSEQ